MGFNSGFKGLRMFGTAIPIRLTCMILKYTHNFAFPSTPKVYLQSLRIGICTAKFRAKHSAFFLIAYLCVPEFLQ